MDNPRLNHLMRKVKIIVSLSALMYVFFQGTPARALDDDRFKFIVGPRVGMSYTFIDWTEFNTQLNEVSYLPIIGEKRSYAPLHTTFALNLEQRILLGTSDSHFCFQELIGISGVEQSILIPMGALLLGFRSGIGFEFGIGPVASLTGLSVAIAAGWNFSFHDVNVPVDIVFVPDFYSGHHSLSLYTGFNFDFD